MIRLRDLSPGLPIPSITPFKRHGEVIGYVTNLGLGEDGKRRRRFFKQRDQAEQFINEHIRTTIDPLHGRRNEVLFSLERVDRIGVSLNEVVEFYVLHGAKKSNPLLSDAINQFLEHKRQIGRGRHHLDRMGVVLDQLTQFVGETTKVGDNLAWTDERTPGSTSFGLPLLDANYGVGDRLQLNYQASWDIARDTGRPSIGGMSDSQLAVKWRYYDAGEHGLQLSIYPRVTFLDPGSDSDRRGLADRETTFLLPFEAQKDFEWFSVNVDGGGLFSAEKKDRGWIGGICIGKEIVKGWVLDTEVHVNADEHASRSEWIANAGSRVDLSEYATLLLAIGRDLRNQLDPKISLLSYIGLQLRF